MSEDRVGEEVGEVAEVVLQTDLVRISGPEVELANAGGQVQIGRGQILGRDSERVHGQAAGPGFPEKKRFEIKLWVFILILIFF